MSKARKGFVTNKLSKKEKIRLSKRASKSFITVTKNGVLGDPTHASAKNGKKFLSEIVHNLIKFLSEIVHNLIKTSQTCLTDKKRKLHQ